MSIIRWNPLRDVSPWRATNDIVGEFASMQREIDRMFDRFLGGTAHDGELSTWLPPVDIIEEDDAYRVKVELPAVDKKDVKITIQNNVLTVRGMKKQDSERKGENYRRVERAYGSFQRSFTLPSSVASDRIEASYDNGLLTVVLPKVEEAKPKEIEVKVK